MLTGTLAAYKIMINFNHILLILLNMEFFMLLNLLSLTTMLNHMSFSFIFFFVFLTCAVCEACVGIGVLIKASRLVGSENLMLIQ